MGKNSIITKHVQYVQSLGGLLLEEYLKSVFTNIL